MNVFIYTDHADDSINFDGLEEDDGKPLRFFAIPRKDDVFYLDETYYRVLLVQYEVFKKRYPRPIFFAEGTMYVKKIGGKLDFIKLLIDAINSDT